MTTDPSTQPESKQWDKVLGLSSLLVAVCALTTTLCQGAATRRHNRFSVLPLVEIQPNLAEDSNPVGFLLVNRGTGPAIIKQSTVYRNDHLIGSLTINTWNSFFTGTDVPFEQIVASTITAETVLSPGAVLPMVRLHAPVQLALMKRATATQLRNEAASLQIRVCYCSVYDECWVTSLAADTTPRVQVPTCSASSVIVGAHQ